MASINLIVAADVIDIRSDIPKRTDSLLVDTNVWFWLTFPKGGGMPHQVNNYPKWVSKARRAGATLKRCGLTMAELAHLIESAEREIFKQANPTITTKEYRHNFAAERTNVVTEIKAAWGQAKTIASMVDLVVDEPTTDAAVNRCQSQLLDGYDLLMLEGMAKAGIAQVLTDDADYATVPGIQVFTANRNVVDAAKTSGKLLTR